MLPNGTLVVGSSFGFIYFIDVTTGVKLSSYRIHSSWSISALELFHKDTLVIASKDGCVKLMNTENGLITAEFNPFSSNASVNCVKVINSYTLAVGGASKNLFLWNSVTGSNQTISLSGPGLTDLVSMVVYQNETITTLATGSNSGQLYIFYLSNLGNLGNLSVSSFIQISSSSSLLSLEATSKDFLKIPSDFQYLNNTFYRFYNLQTPV
jgi:WD40 repeat protein